MSRQEYGSTEPEAKAQPPLQPRVEIPSFETHERAEEFQSVYKTILQTVAKRSSNDKIRVVVITDLAKDFDDLLAMIVLKELHRLNVIQLLGFVANLYPAEKRARLGKGALRQLGLDNIPIAIGTAGEHDNARHEVLPYEFDGSESFIAEEGEVTQPGAELLFEIFSKAKTEGYKVTLLTLSSLMDISQFAQAHPDLLKDNLARCVLQGGYSVVDGKLTADSAATNNHFAMAEAQQFHDFLQANDIPSMCFSKVATFATPIYQVLLTDMESTGVEVGKYLRAVQVGQDLHFWNCASGPVEKRFRPFMNAEWFLQNKTIWYDKHSKDEPSPEGDKIVPYLGKVTAYDCLAAIGVGGEDILSSLGVIKELKLREDVKHARHKIVGVLPVMDPEIKGKVLLPEEANIHGVKFATAIQALALGSLKSVQQGLAVDK